MSGTRVADRPRHVLYGMLAAGALLAVFSGTASAQTSGSPPPPDTQAVQQETPVDPAAQSLLASTRIRGYTDLDFGRPEQETLSAGGLQDAKYSFRVADLELFISSKLSDDWSFFADTLFTTDFTNETEVEIDRMMVQYSTSKYFRVGLGKFNTALSWYANQFHRAKFYQTATGRPVMFADEDEGGMLPMHQIGLTVNGEIPSGTLGLHYVGEVSNGRSYAAGHTGVQTFTDDSNHKAVAGGVSIRPDAAPALDAGFTAYRDTVIGSAQANVSETIVSAHATWVTPNLEILNEFAVVNHGFDGTEGVTSKGFYTEVSKRIQTTRPYVRYDYQNVPANDPVYFLSENPPPPGDRKVLSLGVHFDFGVFAVIKIQYDRALQSGVWANGAHAQLALAF